MQKEFAAAGELSWSQTLLPSQGRGTRRNGRRCLEFFERRKVEAGEFSTNQGGYKFCKRIGMSRSRGKLAKLLFLKLSEVFSESGKLLPLANSFPNIISVWRFCPVGKTTDSKESHSGAILIFMLPVIV